MSTPTRTLKKLCKSSNYYCTAWQKYAIHRSHVTSQCFITTIFVSESQLRDLSVYVTTTKGRRSHIHNYTEYNQQWNVFSAFNPSKCTHTWSSGHCGARGTVRGSVPCSRVSPQSWTLPAGAEIQPTTSVVIINYNNSTKILPQTCSNVFYYNFILICVLEWNVIWTCFMRFILKVCNTFIY